jgi:sigma-E factor negative regulatory protein RseB
MVLLLRSLRFLVLLAAGWAMTAQADVPGTGEHAVAEWLQRVLAAARQRTYIGTLVVSSDAALSSARIWHACDGVQQYERVESMTGTPRSIFRRNDEVVTFNPQTRTAVTEKREVLGLFPQLLKSPDAPIDQFYRAVVQSEERVAGMDADVVALLPRDALRYGYRLWSDKKTGLLLKLQTLDAQGRVLEQVAFSELQLDAPVSMEKLDRMMNNREGYKVEAAPLAKTTARAEGWHMKREVPGFRSISCMRRAATPITAGASSAGNDTVQWVFSDGLASVSVFIEKFDGQRHGASSQQSFGATQAWVQRLPDSTGGWWLTLVGEVPPRTLQLFAQGLARLP